MDAELQTHVAFHLTGRCVGCGACSTVCPSGAMRYAYPDAAHTGRRIQTMLAAYAAAGGRDVVGRGAALHDREFGDAPAHVGRADRPPLHAAHGLFKGGCLRCSDEHDREKRGGQEFYHRILDA